MRPLHTPPAAGRHNAPFGAAPLGAVTGERVATSGEQTPAALWVAEMLSSEKNRCLFFEVLVNVVGSQGA